MGTELERTITASLQLSKAGREICPAVIQDAVRWALTRYTAKDAEKAAKTRLHGFYGAWVDEGWLKRAEKTLSALEHGEMDAREAAVALLHVHGSTSERLAHIRECYDRIFAACGVPATALDIACGMNPVSFRLLGLDTVTLTAIDAGTHVTAVLNRFFALSSMPNAAACAGDAMTALPAGRYDMALVMKFLPLAERLVKGGALRLLNSIHAGHIVVSFPTRSLSGRNVGMEKNYSEWFEGLGFEGRIIDRFVCGNEVFYIVDKYESEHSVWQPG